MSNAVDQLGPAGRIIRRDPWFVRWPLIGFVVCALGVLVVAPLLNVFVQALSLGHAVALAALTEPDTLAAVRLTLLVAGLSVLANLTFGLAAGWAIARFRFPGKALLTALIDLPFTVSPVVAGLLFVLIFGSYGYLGPVLQRHHVHIIWAWPGMVLATTFVTFPFIARELIPVLEAVGPEEEQAARTLGASGWQMLWHVTLPNVKWGLLYGVLLCNARAMGEFGAVSVVSGKKVGQTETLPLRIDTLYHGMGRASNASAFAVAGLLVGLALLILAGKTFLARSQRSVISDPHRTVRRGGGRTVTSASDL
jgi:sulfate transport system permease protein